MSKKPVKRTIPEILKEDVQPLENGDVTTSSEAWEVLTDTSPVTVPPLYDEAALARLAALSDEAEKSFRVVLLLPYSVMVALIDREHPHADTERANLLGLMNKDLSLTAIGQLALDGCDQTVIYHKMYAKTKGWKE